MSRTGGEPLAAAPAHAGNAQPHADATERTGDARLRVVVLTTFFPSPREPFRTPFLRNLVDAMAGDCEQELVIPVPPRPPIGPWRDAQPVPARESHAGWTLAHPRYLA